MWLWSSSLMCWCYWYPLSMFSKQRMWRNYFIKSQKHENRFLIHVWLYCWCPLLSQKNTNIVKSQIVKLLNHGVIGCCTNADSAQPSDTSATWHAVDPCHGDDGASGHGVIGSRARLSECREKRARRLGHNDHGGHGGCSLSRRWRLYRTLHDRLLNERAVLVPAITADTAVNPCPSHGDDGGQGARLSVWDVVHLRYLKIYQDIYKYHRYL